MTDSLTNSLKEAALDLRRRIEQKVENGAAGGWPP